MNDLIKHKLELLPNNPGCYLHKDKFGNIIYVGKAKNLKNRVRSYFRGSHDTKTELLVSEIADFEFIVTESNIEALLLEINLIQENMPKFNIRLKDDKSYPFIKITKELYPRLLITRQVKKDGGLYFGPYPDSGAANEIKKLLDRIFPFKKCKNPANKVCFYYHIGQCNAHTICHTTEDYWQGLVEDVKNFLNGHDDKIVNQLKAKMKDMSDQMEFERAAEYRDLIEAVSTLRTKQRVIRQDMQDRDIFGYHVDKGWMCVQVFFVRQGKLIERDVNLFPYYNDPDEDFLTYVGQFYQEKSHLIPNEILIPQDIDEEAVKKVTVGLEKKERVISDKDKKLTAYHEAGHAVVGRYLPTQSNVKEVSIIPRGVAGGYTMYKSDEDKYYISKTEMQERLTALLGGRAAEKLVLNDISTGASNDIEVATNIARDMVTKYGMSDVLGPIDFKGKEPYEMQLFGENIGDKIGQEVKLLIDSAYERAQQLLVKHRDKLEIIAQTLLEKEKINETEFNKIFEEEL